MDHLDRARTDATARRAAAAASRASASRAFSEALRGARASPAGARPAAPSPRAPGREPGGAGHGPLGASEEATISRGPGSRPFFAAEPRRRSAGHDAFPRAEPDVARAGQPPVELARGWQATAAGEGAGLRAAVRALPVAVETFHARGGGALALELGRALSVELRSAPGGVQILLRPDAALSRVASAELPGLVGALRARGVAVASAAVRARPGRG